VETYKWLSIAAVVACMAIGAGPAFAKSRHPSQSSGAGHDQITIESHIPLANGPVIELEITERNSHSYVYAKRAAGKGTTLIDLTQPEHPKVLGKVTGAEVGNLVTIAGTAALSISAPGSATPVAAPVPRTIQILDLSNPDSPRVTRRFDSVTAIGKLPGKGLIVLANGEGLWVLSEHIAEDPAAAERYARKVIYGESRY